MPLDLEQVSELVSTVAREKDLDAEVIGVTGAEGEGCYAEAIVTIRVDDGEHRRVSVGLQRDAAPEDLRHRIAERLDTALSR